MRLFVKYGFGDSSYVIPCNDAGITVSKLKQDIVVRINGGDAEEKQHSGYKLFLSGNGAVLNDADIVGDVLKDGDFITLGKLALATFKDFTSTLLKKQVGQKMKTMTLPLART